MRNSLAHTFYCCKPASSRDTVEHRGGRIKTVHCSCSRGQPVAFPTTFLTHPQFSLFSFFFFALGPSRQATHDKQQETKAVIWPAVQLKFNNKCDLDQSWKDDLLTEWRNAVFGAWRAEAILQTEVKSICCLLFHAVCAVIKGDGRALSMPLSAYACHFSGGQITWNNCCIPLRLCWGDSRLQLTALENNAGGDWDTFYERLCGGNFHRNILMLISFQVQTVKEVDTVIWSQIFKSCLYLQKFTFMDVHSPIT